MGITTENIKQIIAAAHPNQNLVDKAWEKYDIGAQKAKEQQFYDKITMKDPVTGQPIKTIEQLNALVNHLDTVFNLQALLPSGTEGGGEVERILSRKYNLKLRESNKFTEQEQKRLQASMQRLADLAFNLLSDDPEFNRFVTKGAEDRIWAMLLAYMGKVQVADAKSFITLFISGSLEKMPLVQNIYEDMLNGKTIPIIKMKTLSENITGSKRTSKREGFNFIRDENDYRQTKPIIGVEFNPNFNKLSGLTFDQFYAYAKEEGNILEKGLETDAENKLGTGEKSPMKATPEEWREDVYNAIYEALSKGAWGTLVQGQDEIDTKQIIQSLLDKYNVYENIALFRSQDTLKGFMGELRGILIVHLLFPKGDNFLLGKASVTLENSFRSGEAPIDVLVQILDQAFGIQVKNITDLDEYSWGNFRDKKGMAVPNFYVERLQSILDTDETDFFGAYAYNKPVGKPSDPNPYRDIYEGFGAAFENKFVPVYQQLALYIIRQITKIKNSNNSLLNGTIKNDFFFMNNKIVPASAFLQSVTDNNDLIESSFTLSSPTMGHYSSSAKQPSDYGSYTKESFIHYEVSVQFSKLLQSAFSP